MAIFIYCEDCETTVEPNSCKHNKGFNQVSNDVGKYINMRKTLSGTTKIEFNHTSMADDIKSRGGSL